MCLPDNLFLGYYLKSDIERTTMKIIKRFKFAYMFLSFLLVISSYYTAAKASVATTAQTTTSIVTNNLTSLLKTAEGSCTTDLECKSGIYFVKNNDATSLAKISKDLKAQGQQTDQFTNNRYAILVAPGTYDMNKVKNIESGAFNLGYYTQILGVGKSMEDVTITPGVEVYNQGGFLKGAPTCETEEKQKNPLCLTLGGLNNFWRGIENFSMNKTPIPGVDDVIRFAVSQAAPIRSIHFIGSDVLLCDYKTADWKCGSTSGGFMANSKVDLKLKPGSQQQWLSRNSEYGPTDSENPEVAAWNSVFVGTTLKTLPAQKKDPFPFEYNKPEAVKEQWENFPVVNIAQTTVSKEKPYLSCGTTCNGLEKDIKWMVEVPTVRKNSSGIDKTTPSTLDVATQFIIISPNSGPTGTSGVTTLNTEAINTINNELALGKNLLITPGVYNLDGGTINVSKDNTIVLGLGLPSLVCTNDAGCIHVTANGGVDLAGLTLEAGYKLTPSLLQIGSSSGTSDSNNPIFLHDLFFRIAETQLTSRVAGQERQTTTAAVIYTSFVVGDNLWIWRADHDKASSHDMVNPELNLVKWGQDRAKYGLIVYGDNITINGLAVEHFQDYQTVWNGNNGMVNFYQSEMPYDVPSLSEWKCTLPDGGTSETGVGCASYVVDHNVTTHTANGLGVFTYFVESGTPIKPKSAFIIPQNSMVTLNYLIGKWLNGSKTSGLNNLVTTTLGDKCWGFGVSYTPDDKNKSQFSVLGKVDHAKTNAACSVK